MPDLSVVLTIDRMRERGEAALESILAQKTRHDIEVLLVDHGADRYPALHGAEDNRVRVLAPGPLTSYGESLEFAVGRTESPVVAFLEEHALACPGWAEALVAAHAQGWSGVGCQIRPALTGNRVSMGMSLINDIEWLAPTSARPAQHLRGHNASYKTKILRSLDDELPRLLEYEYYLQRRILQTGGKLFIEPKATVVHLNDSTFASMMYVYYVWNRGFGQARSQFEDWQFFSKFVRVTMVPLIVGLRSVEALFHAARKEEIGVARALAHGDVILAAQAAATIGQAAGLLFGPGTARCQFAEHELNADRKPPPDGLQVC